MNKVQSIPNDSASLVTNTENNKQEDRSSQTENTLKLTESCNSMIASCTSRNTADNEIVDRSADLFTYLPSEAISHVLSYLPLSDLKSVRLTCQSLNECSQHISIAKREKFVFPGCHVVPSSLFHEFLSQTNRATLNLEFQERHNYDISHPPSHVWRTCGDRVRSLYIICSGDLYTIQSLEDIFSYCHNLEVLELRASSDERKLRAGLEYVFDHLIQLNVKHTRLHTLKFGHALDDDHLLRKIFTIFPKLKRLHVTPTFHYEINTKRTHIKCPDDLIASEPGAKRLAQEAKNNRPDNPLIARFSIHTELAALYLSITERVHEGVRELMLNVLKRCPKLSVFSFTFPNYCPLLTLTTPDEVTEFLSLISHLQYFEVSYLPRTPRGLSLPPVFLALNILQVELLCDDPEEFFFHILKHCPKLEHLTIGNIDRMPLDTLTKIFRYTPSKLRTFVVTPGSIDDDCELDRRDISDKDHCVKGLQNLEFLSLNYCYYFDEILKKTQFRRLRYLKLSQGNEEIFRMGTPWEFFQILLNAPTLEIVELPQVKLWSFMIRKLEDFQDLKNLRLLMCAEVGGGYDAKRLFEVCSNLKFVADPRHTYSFDSLTGNVISEPRDVSVKKLGRLYRTVITWCE